MVPVESPLLFYSEEPNLYPFAKQWLILQVSFLLEEALGTLLIPFCLHHMRESTLSTLQEGQKVTKGKDGDVLYSGYYPTEKNEFESTSSNTHYQFRWFPPFCHRTQKTVSGFSWAASAVCRYETEQEAPRPTIGVRLYRHILYACRHHIATQLYIHNALIIHICYISAMETLKHGTAYCASWLFEHHSIWRQVSILVFQVEACCSNFSDISSQHFRFVLDWHKSIQ